MAFRPSETTALNLKLADRWAVEEKSLSVCWLAYLRGLLCAEEGGCAVSEKPKSEKETLLEALDVLDRDPVSPDGAHLPLGVCERAGAKASDLASDAESLTAATLTPL